MPRRKADKVVEHRISLSDGLHKEMKQVIKTQKQSAQIAQIGNGAKGVLQVAAVGGLGFVAYLGVKSYAEIKGVMPQVKETFQNVWDWGFGVDRQADGSLVPSSVVITNSDGSQERVVNKFNEIPILNKIWGLGGLYQWGMEIGAANNPFEGEDKGYVSNDDMAYEDMQNQIYEQYLRDKFFEEHGYHNYDAFEAWKAQQGSWDEVEFQGEYTPPVEVIVPEIDLGIDDLDRFEEMNNNDPMNSDAPVSRKIWDEYSRIMRSAGVDMVVTLDMNFTYAQYLAWWNQSFSNSRS